MRSRNTNCFFVEGIEDLPSQFKVEMQTNFESAREPIKSWENAIFEILNERKNQTYSTFHLDDKNIEKV